MDNARDMKKAASDMDAIETLPLESLLFDGHDDINATNELGQTALMKACDEGCLQKVVSLIRHGADLDCTDPELWTAMTFACRHGFAPLVELLVEHGATIIETGKRNDDSVLRIAMQYGHWSLAKYLINNITNHVLLFTPLMRACANGWKDIVELLSSKRYDNDSNIIQCYKTVIGTTPLMNACENNHPAIAHMLLKLNAGVNMMDHKGTTALFYACENGMTEVVDVILRSNPQRNNLQSKFAFHALMTCKNTSSLLPVFVYFATGSISNLQTQDITTRPERHSVNKATWEYTSFVFSCLFDNDGNDSDISVLDHPTDSVFWVLLEHIDGYKAAVDALTLSPKEERYCIGQTLKCCIDAGKVGGLKILFKQGIDFYVKLPYEHSFENRFTPLAYALCRNQPHIANWLLNELNQYAVEEAFGLACEYGSKDGVLHLLKHGIDPAIVHGTLPLPAAATVYDYYDDDNPKSAPLIRASRGGHREIVQLLLDYGVDVNTQNYKGYTPLIAHLDYGYRYDNIVDILLNNGADLNVVDKYDRSAFTHVIKFSKDNITVIEKTLNLFVESGQLLTPKNRLKPVHCKPWDSQYHNTLELPFDKRVSILTNLDLFEWCLFSEGSFSLVIPEAIAEGLSPPAGPNSGEGSSSSPLVVSFQKRDLQLTLHILDKLYFLPEDYQQLKSQYFCKADESLITSSSDEGQQLEKLEETLKHRLLDTPQCLRDICFLCVSRVISVNYAPCSRKQMVERLPLPTPLKKQLMFK